MLIALTFIVSVLISMLALSHSITKSDHPLNHRRPADPGLKNHSGAGKQDIAVIVGAGNIGELYAKPLIARGK